MTAPGVYTPSQGSRDEELVEVVANALRDPIQRDNELYWAAEYGRPVPQDSLVIFATAAINAIREWEGR